MKTLMMKNIGQRFEAKRIIFKYDFQKQKTNP